MDIQLYLTEVKGPVMDRLARTEFLAQLGPERVFLTTQAAFEQLASASPSPDTVEPSKGFVTSPE